MSISAKKILNELHVQFLATELAYKMARTRAGWGTTKANIYELDWTIYNKTNVELADLCRSSFGNEIRVVLNGMGAAVSGGIRWYVEVLNRLVNLGFDVVCHLENPPFSSDWLPSKFDIEPLRNLAKYEGILLASFSEDRDCFAEAKKAQVKIYVSQGFEPAFTHMSRPWRIRAMRSYLFEDVWYMAVSHYLHTVLSETFNRSVLPHLVSPGVDLGLFRFVPWEDRNSERLIIGFLNRQEFLRGTDLVEKIHRKVANVIPVDVHGFVDICQEKLAQAYSRCHIFLDPSRVGGFMMPPLEAMACGTVPVAASLGAATYISHQNNGYLVARDNVGKFVHTIVSAWENPEKLSRMGLHAHDTAKLFSWDATVKNFLLNLLSIANSTSKTPY